MALASEARARHSAVNYLLKTVIGSNATICLQVRRANHCAAVARHRATT